MKLKILVVDDEEIILKLLEKGLKDEGYQVEVAADGIEGLEKITSQCFDIILLDQRMPGMDGLELLEKIKSIDKKTIVIFMTAFGSIHMAVEAMKKGAYDFITKPLDIDRILSIINKAIERYGIFKEYFELIENFKQDGDFLEFIGNSSKMRKIYKTIQMVAKTDATILITGETGTGKELAAKAIHRLSDRSQIDLISINCPTLPETLLESELFGHKKGAFTGATSDRKGIFEEADGGTIFLDEIGDISLGVQAKLLRVLQNGEVKPLGGTRTKKVNVRIIVSTNQDLGKKVKEHSFREDLFYRLNVVPIDMPPLRERREDIPLLASNFLKKYCRKFAVAEKVLAPESMKFLYHQKWKGNVRELENSIIKAIILTPEEEIYPEDLNTCINEDSPEIDISEQINNLPYKIARERILKNFNLNFITGILKRNGGNVSQSARECKIERQYLQQIMRRCNIISADFRPAPEAKYLTG